MTPRKTLLIVVGVLVLIISSAATIFIGYRTISNSGEQAVAEMTVEEVKALELLSPISRDMTPKEVYQSLGSPSEDLYFFAKWNGFGGSTLSQARVYFDGQHPTKIRWLKLGFFIYEKNL